MRYQGLVPRMRWNAGFDQELVFALPLERAKSWRDPGEGSVWSRSPGGIEDAWIESSDWFLRGMMRRIPRDRTVNPPASGWDETNGVEAWLAWMRDKNIGRFYPDGRNLFDSPRLATFVGSVATDWSSYVAAGTFTFGPTGDPGQRITCSGSTAAAQWAAVIQTVYGIRAGDALALSVGYRTNLPVNTQPVIVIIWYDAAGAAISQISTAFAASVPFVRGSLLAVAPAGTVKAEIHLRNQTTAAGASGDVVFKEAMIERQTSASPAFIDNPGYYNLQLQEPMKGEPGQESDLMRQIELLFRSSDRVALPGF